MDKIIKYFNEKGNVIFGNKVDNEKYKVIRVIPKNHSYFNNGSEYFQLSVEDINHLSEGDMICVTTDMGTDWYELTYSSEISSLVYKGFFNVLSLFHDRRVNSVKVRNDFYIPMYAQDENYINNGASLDKQIACLSSGTVGTLIQSNKYEDIDKVINDFKEYSKCLPNNYKWQSAWKLFDEYNKVNN